MRERKKRCSGTKENLRARSVYQYHASSQPSLVLSLKLLWNEKSMPYNIQPGIGGLVKSSGYHTFGRHLVKVRMSCLVVLILVKRHRNIGRFCLFVHVFNNSILSDSWMPTTHYQGLWIYFQLLMIVMTDGITKFKESISDLILYTYTCAVSSRRRWGFLTGINTENFIPFSERKSPPPPPRPLPFQHL
jgi:hypothetical protein